jgi:hypothetical protein
VIAIAHNLSLTLGLSWKGDCGRTCGPAGYFAVFLMFLVLCGGVWLLLQSSFGPLQAYLISSVAFWGSWLVLAIIWFTGVPGIPIDRLPGIEKGIPASTPRYYGPTGTVATWDPLPADDPAVAGREFFNAEGTIRQGDTEQLKSAETEAATVIGEHYAEELGVKASEVGVPGVVVLTKKEFARSGGGIAYTRFTTGPAKAGETATPEERELIGKIKPATFVLKYDRGSVEQPTRMWLPTFFILFLGHMLWLIWYEKRHRPMPAPARERQREPEKVTVA